MVSSLRGFLGVIGIIGGISGSFLSIEAYAFHRNYEKVKDTVPCLGEAGKYTRNLDGSKGGFVAQNARVRKTLSGYNSNIPYIAATAQVCGEAWIEDSAILYDEVYVGSHAYIGRKVTLGKGVRIGKGAYVSSNVTLQDNSHVPDFGFVPSNQKTPPCTQFVEFPIDDLLTAFPFENFTKNEEQAFEKYLAKRIENSFDHDLASILKDSGISRQERLQILIDQVSEDIEFYKTPEDSAPDEIATNQWLIDILKEVLANLLRAQEAISKQDSIEIVILK